MFVSSGLNRFLVLQRGEDGQQMETYVEWETHSVISQSLLGIMAPSLPPAARTHFEETVLQKWQSCLANVTPNHKIHEAPEYISETTAKFDVHRRGFIKYMNAKAHKLNYPHQSLFFFLSVFTLIERWKTSFSTSLYRQLERASPTVKNSFFLFFLKKKLCSLRAKKNNVH